MCYSIRKVMSFSILATAEKAEQKRGEEEDENIAEKSGEIFW